MKNNFKAGVVQFDVKSGQVETNLNTVFGHLEKLASENVSLAVLPEMFSCSFDNENLSKHSKLSDKVVESLSFFARKNQMAIAGTLPEKEKDQIFNTMVFIDVDGKVKARYRKMHLFRLTGEHLYYTAGNKIVTIDSSFGRLGLMICYDLRFPELARSLYLKDAQMIIVSAQWPESRKEHWKTLIKARSIENQLFMVCSNRTGMEGDLRFPGMSMIIDPMGNVLTEAANNEKIAFADIDPGLVKKARTLIPCSTDRRQEIYG
ncbi:MAG: carbon-nitrogen family hydrolase [Proteobacteria bacterium]|nr:carbon-nitrogen family hydrolase [Pseudomonadota bacterium]MBU1697410.1 carbon-nitrogen family hydrolase [Pseudomonadota bacterium]